MINFYTLKHILSYETATSEKMYFRILYLKKKNSMLKEMQSCCLFSCVFTWQEVINTDV